jgi:hypothetical protein
MKTLTTTTLALAATFWLNAIAIFPVATQEVELDSLCSKFPFNSRCEKYPAFKLPQETYQVDRNTLCRKFPYNSNCQEPAPQVFKFKLDLSGEDAEWVRLEKNGNRVKLLHTKQVINNLASTAIDSALSFLPVPLPFVDTNQYKWEDHQVTGVAFKPDRCKKSSHCQIIGTNTLILPKKTGIYAGLFTVEYTEGDYQRSLTFRVPTDVLAETTNLITEK